MLIKPRYQRHFYLAALLIAVLGYLFWTGSRYPSLNEKAMMSGAIQLEDALSFEARFPITAEMGTAEHIFYSTLNWIETNRKGMIFGVLFAAAFLTAASYLKTRSFKGRFPNAVLGLVIGTPLGVCVNCAAPIARGMYSAGLRAETTLAAMIASPTLNVVVLTMVFSLMPLYMAVTKIALSLILILIFVPLMAPYLPRTVIESTKRVQTPWSASELNLANPKVDPFHVAIWEVARTYVWNLWYIVKMTVPLMLLAGLLGTVVAIFLPADSILGMPFSVFVLIIVAAVGVFLPVPIGFDVVMAGVLLSSGMAQGFVMALLFTLGSFSVYSFFIVAQSVGRKAAWMLAGAVMTLGVLSGWGAQVWHDRQSDDALEILTGALDLPAFSSLWAAQAETTDPWTVTSPDGSRISLSPLPFAPRPGGTTTGFTRMEAAEIGIDAPLEFSMADMWPPFWEGRSLASGDIDNDGDLDLVVASTQNGLYVYANDGTGHFSRMAINLGPVASLPVFNAVLADVDNDGWRDLILATYRQGNYVWKNTSGRFEGAPTLIANHDGAVLSLALTLADPDRDGDLDLGLGNWTSGWYRRVPGEESRNRIVWNDDGLSGDKYTDLPGIPGETLTMLFSDFDRDGAADLLVGNDFEIPDDIYRGDGLGGFTKITHADGIVPHTTTTTMAIKVDDLMNDGMPELYFAQIAGRSSGVSSKLKMQPIGLYCDGITAPAAKAICAKNMAIKTWYRSGNNFDPTYASECQKMTGEDQAECKAMLIKDLAIQRRDPKICALIPENQPRPRSFCDLHFLPVRAITAAEAEESIQQVLRSNVLLETRDNAYVDTASQHGLEVGGWSWDTKVADFDQDGWQDVYIVNGTWVPNEVTPSNLFYHNNGDGSFTEASGPFGLEDFLMTAAATAFDMDGDGDLDLVTHPVNGPLAVFRNDVSTGNAIAFQLIDEAGNRDGIGAVVSITDDTGRTMSREIQIGGGFMSFDAPRVHFGLGLATSVRSLSLRWADGTVTQIAGPLPAGALYTLHRSP